jgi:hypothetical protein
VSIPQQRSISQNVGIGFIQQRRFDAMDTKQTLQYCVHIASIAHINKPAKPHEGTNVRSNTWHNKIMLVSGTQPHPKPANSRYSQKRCKLTSQATCETTSAATLSVDCRRCDCCVNCFCRCFRHCESTYCSVDLQHEKRKPQDDHRCAHSCK